MTSFSSEPEDTLPRPSSSSREVRPSAAPKAEEREGEPRLEGARSEERGVLRPQPKPQPRRRPDRRIDADPGDPEGTHVCAPTDA